MKYIFPFGSQLQKVEQIDKSPKKVFVLEVYASAVHAKWIGVDGKVKVNALAVASEPYIFWKGENAKEIIDKIPIPEVCGKLIPADKRFNGPSGIALDELFLKPLGYTREDAWLCDLLPYSRINTNQQKAIERHYNPLIKKFNLPECTIPKFSAVELNKPERANEIVDELEQSQAEKIILLGDLPIKHFLSHFSNHKKLSDFGCTINDYGREHPVTIRNKTYIVIPLVHPRQAAALGRSNLDWKKLHNEWNIQQQKHNN
jgi:uracil-DNA glycosylase